MADAKRLKDAIETIREECLSHENCEECIFYHPTSFKGEAETNCYLMFYPPCLWDRLKVGEPDG